MLIEHESLIRASIFLGGLFSLWLTGLYLPYRPVNFSQRRKQWLNNLFLTVFNALLIKLLVPLSLTALALFCEEKSLGLLNKLPINEILAVITTIIVLDLTIYWQHRLTHKLPFLWRIHRLHHSDTEIDVTTAGRFHIFEILFSFAVKTLVILATGAPAAAVIAFEVLLNLSAMFNHTNISFTKPLEAVLRSLIVTPDMHRIHHSSKPSETDSNYGFCLSLWDRVFKSYSAQASEDARTMQIGLKTFRSTEEQSLRALFIQPFK